MTMPTSGEELFAIASKMLQSDESALTYGPVHWQELARMVGSRHASGLLLGTNRRLLFLGEFSRNPTTLLYNAIARTEFVKRFLGSYLAVSMVDAQTASFFGKKKLLKGMHLLVEDRREAPLPTLKPTTVIYHEGKINMTCTDCSAAVGEGWLICPACARSVDWSASAQAVQQYRDAMAQYRAP